MMSRCMSFARLVLGSLLVDIGLGLQRSRISKGFQEGGAQICKGNGVTNVVAGLVDLVTNSVLGCGGTRCKGGVAVLGDA